MSLLSETEAAALVGGEFAFGINLFADFAEGFEFRVASFEQSARLAAVFGEIEAAFGVGDDGIEGEDAGRVFAEIGEAGLIKEIGAD